MLRILALLFIGLTIISCNRPNSKNENLDSENVNIENTPNTNSSMAMSPKANIIQGPPSIKMAKPTLFFRTKNSISIGGSSSGWVVEKFSVTCGNLISTEDPFLMNGADRRKISA